MKKSSRETERAVSVATGSLLSAISQYSELIWSLSHQRSILAAECIRTINADYTNILSLYPPWHTILNISPDQLLISSGNWTILNSLVTVSRRYRCSQTSNFSDFISKLSLFHTLILFLHFYWNVFQNSCARCGNGMWYSIVYVSVF